MSVCICVFSKGNKASWKMLFWRPLATPYIRVCSCMYCVCVCVFAYVLHCLCFTQTRGRHENGANKQYVSCIIFLWRHNTHKHPAFWKAGLPGMCHKTPLLLLWNVWKPWLMFIITSDESMQNDTHCQNTKSIKSDLINLTSALIYLLLFTLQKII